MDKQTALNHSFANCLGIIVKCLINIIVRQSILFSRDVTPSGQKMTDLAMLDTKLMEQLQSNITILKTRI